MFPHDRVKPMTDLAVVDYLKVHWHELPRGADVIVIIPPPLRDSLAYDLMAWSHSLDLRERTARRIVDVFDRCLTIFSEQGPPDALCGLSLDLVIWVNGGYLALLENIWCRLKD